LLPLLLLTTPTIRRQGDTDALVLGHHRKPGLLNTPAKGGRLKDAGHRLPISVESTGWTG
jgi:hypothetical protein